jgi:hypothetical protein
VQRTVQAEFLPDNPGGWIDFAYPPFVAILFVPLAALPFKAAFSVYSIAQISACIGAVALAGTVTRTIRANGLIAAAITLSFYPLMRSVLGGQNTGFSVLCATGIAVYLWRSNDLVAGLWAGAWLFKPQLALPVVLMVSPHRTRHFWVGLGVVAAAYYALGTLIGGPGWPWWWWHEGVLPFAGADLLIDRANGLSLREVGFRIGLTVLPTVLGALVLLLAAWRCWFGKPTAIGLTAVAVNATLLASPHTLFYDAGLLLVCLWLAVEIESSRLRSLAITAWGMANLQVASAWLPIPPAFVALVSAAAMTWIAADTSPPVA